MITYSFLQHYWWLLISLLGGLLVFLLFVQGGNALLFSIGKTEQERQMLTASTGRKWELTFTTLVTFGGAFFASFPLFYSTSFGGAYWVWMLILISFVAQAVSYEFPQYVGNVLGRRGYRLLLSFNGYAGPFLLGAAVATMYNGASFVVQKSSLATAAAPVVSSWTSPWHGLEALADPWNWALGAAVLFLARYLGSLYYINNVDDEAIRSRALLWTKRCAAVFLVTFLMFLFHLFTMNGIAEAADGTLSVEPYKYLHNLTAMPIVAALLLIGVLLVLWSMLLTWMRGSRRGIWPAGAGTVLTVMAMLLLAGWNGTAYYPSLTHPECSLTITNSSSSFFTLKVMAGASLVIPFVVAYIAYCWRAIDKKSQSDDR